MGIIDNSIVATVMEGYEGHRGWINYLAISPVIQRQGIAREMMEDAENKLSALGCPKINLQIRSTNTQVINFYKRIGYTDDEVLSMGKRLAQDSPYNE